MLESRIEGQLGIMTMNNDARRNVISQRLIDEVAGALGHFRNQRVRCVIFRANKGVGVWSAGHDVEELPPPGHDPLHWSDTLPHLVRIIQKFPAPVIAMVEGSVWGGAVEMAMACDLVVASRYSTFAITPAKLGLPYHINGLSTLSRLVMPHILRELMFTAKPLTAERLAATGAINYAIDPAELESFCFDMADHICNNSPLAISVTKDALRAFIGRDLPVSEFERLEEIREDVYSSADYAEGLDAFRNKRKPVFTGDAHDVA